MPDKHCLSYLEHDIIDILVGRLKADIDSTVTSIFRVLSKLATKSNVSLYNPFRYRRVQIKDT